MKLLGVLCLAMLALGGAPALRAQAATSVIRGRIFAIDSTPIPDAVISLTSTAGVQAVRADRNGLYTMRIRRGEQAVAVEVRAIGYQAESRAIDVQRLEAFTIIDFYLVRTPSRLSTVAVRARRRPPRLNPLAPDPMASARGVDRKAVVTGQSEISANDAAASAPGVVVGPDGISVLGARPEESIVTLNGATLSAAARCSRSRQRDHRQLRPVTRRLQWWADRAAILGRRKPFASQCQPSC